MLLALSLANPLLLGDRVVGPALGNTLVIAYLLPALVLHFGFRWARPPLPWLRRGSQALALGLLTLWTGLVIRHFWQGAEGMAEWKGVSQPELYSYTIALLLVGGLVFARALRGGKPRLRRIGLILIGLATAKVFLIDITGLEGLMRALSFLVLGFALAGLAWLDRWFDQDQKQKSEEA